MNALDNAAMREFLAAVRECLDFDLTGDDTTDLRLALFRKQCVRVSLSGLTEAALDGAALREETMILRQCATVGPDLMGAPRSARPTAVAS